MTCSDAVRLIGSAIEGHLSRQPARTLASHLAQCQRCRAEVVTQILVKRALAATPDAVPPDTLVDKIARRLDDESSFRAPQKKTASPVV